MKRERNENIRQMYASGAANMQEIANQFGISRQRVEQIITAEVSAAREAFHRAVASGAVVPAEHCQVCGGKDQKITAHHADYGRPYDVIWVCILCHPLLDRGRKRREVANRTKQEMGDVLTATEAADRIGIPRRSFGAWAKSNRPRSLQRRGFKYYRVADIDKAIERARLRDSKKKACKHGHLLTEENRNAAGQCRACIAKKVLQIKTGRTGTVFASTHVVRNALRLAGIGHVQVSGLRFHVGGLQVTRGHRSPWIVKRKGGTQELGRAKSAADVVSLLRQYQYEWMEKVA